MMDSVVDYIIRPLYPEEIHLLRDFLYEAIFIPEGVEPLPRDVVVYPSGMQIILTSNMELWQFLFLMG